MKTTTRRAKDLLSDILSERTGPGRPAPMMHVDSRLPAEIACDAEALRALAGAVLDWALEHAGPEGAAAVALWRGGAPGAGDQRDLVVEACAWQREGRRPPPVPDAVTRAAGAIDAAPPSMHLDAGRARLTVSLPDALDPSTAPARDWGTALEGRRVLCINRALIDPERLAASARAAGLDWQTAPGAAEALATLAEARAGGRGFDIVLVCARLAGPEAPAVVKGIRALPGGRELRILVIDLPDEVRPADVDALLPRAGSERSIFGFCFDALRQPRCPSGTPLPDEVPALVSRRILIVEDVAMNRSLLEAMLAPTGATCELAANGSEAVEAIRRQPADLVLMDIQMPTMDGLEATRRIRALSADMPVIALTANARETDRATYLAAGMNGYLAKPIRVDDLYAILRRELG